MTRLIQFMDPPDPQCPSAILVNGLCVPCEKRPGHLHTTDLIPMHRGDSPRTDSAESIAAAWTADQCGDSFVYPEACPAEAQPSLLTPTTPEARTSPPLVAASGRGFGGTA